jgi:hypothetical protein
VRLVEQEAPNTWLYAKVVQEFSQCLPVFHWRHSAYVLKLPLNGGKFLDPGNAQQIPVRLSLFSLKKLGFHYQKARNNHFSKPEERISSLQELDSRRKNSKQTYPVSIRNFDAGILKQLSGNASHLWGPTFFHKYVKKSRLFYSNMKISRIARSSILSFLSRSEVCGE